MGIYGLPDEFLNKKDPINIDAAQKIVEGYDFRRSIGRELTEREKAGLMVSLLSNGELNTSGSAYLSSLRKNLINKGIELQDVFEIIIISAVNRHYTIGEESFYYDDILHLMSAFSVTIEKHLLEAKQKNKISETTIDYAVCNFLGMLKKMESESHEKPGALTEFEIELFELGLDRGFYEKKDIKNIYTAKKIIEGCKFKESIERDLTKNEKAALIMSLLKNHNLDNDADTPSQLNLLIKKLQGDNIENQDIYRIITYIAVRGSITLGKKTLFYDDLLNSQNKGVSILKEHFIEAKEKSKADALLIDDAMSEYLNLSEQQANEIQRELIEELGLDREFIETKNIRNVYMAKRIVEGYSFEKPLNRDEKAGIIKALLNPGVLNRDHFSLIISMIKGFDVPGISFQDIFGIIINLAVIGRINFGEKTLTYKYALSSPNKIYTILGNVPLNEIKEKSKVAPLTIDEAVADYLNSPVDNSNELQEELINELEMLGLDRDFLRTKDIRNVYIAKRIVEGYNFGKELSEYEQASLIGAILNSDRLNKKSGGYLTSLIKRVQTVEKAKLQDIYRIIIYIAVMKKINFKEKRINYNSLVRLEDSSLQMVKDYFPEIAKQTTVSEAVVKKAYEEFFNSKLKALGLDNSVIEPKQKKNVETAVQIVDLYDFEKDLGRRLTNEEKAALVKCILNGFSKLKKYNEKFEKMGFENQTITAMIIIFSVTGEININSKVLNVYGRRIEGDVYTLQEQNKFVNEIEEYLKESLPKDFHFTVTEEIISQAVKKASKFMKPKEQMTAEELGAAGLPVLAVQNGG